METAALIDALRRPDAWPGPPRTPVTILQTHISVLFFVDDHVFKVKKPVRPAFLDYSTLEQRRRFCHEEVRLNRRLAPDVYLGVTPIVRTPDGQLRATGSDDIDPDDIKADDTDSDDIVEYAVRMARLPADRMLDAVLKRGDLTNDDLNALVDRLVAFHAGARSGPAVAVFGRAEEIIRQTHDNLDGLAAFVGEITTSRQFGYLRRVMDQWLAVNRDRLDARAAAGRVREGHGDLHTGNICLLEHGVVIYDCIEFSDRFRCRDVAAELAFLAMDLDHRGRRGFARDLLHRYAEASDDPALLEIAWFFKIHFALVRAKVAAMRAADRDVPADERAGAREAARSYAQLAVAESLPPVLILTCGLPGTGKSFAARAIAAPFAAAVIRTDVVRKELARDAPPDDLYASAFTDRTYAAALDHTLAQLAEGESVVVDATFAQATRRAPFIAAARDHGVALLLVELTCDEKEVQARMRARSTDPTEVSDADWAVYQDARSRFEPPAEVDPAARLTVASPIQASDLVDNVLDRLIEVTADIAPGSGTIRRPTSGDTP